MNNNNELLNMFSAMIRKGGNPKIIAQEMLKSNPQAQELYQQMQNMASGLSPREFALRYAKQNGINEQEVLNLARQFGIN